MKKGPIRTAWSRMIGMTVGVLLVTATKVVAEATTFRNGGLKNATIVTLEVKGKTASGTFVSYEYGENIPPATSFTGKVLPTPKGKRGVYLEIRFAGAPPYAAPPDAKALVWYLKSVNRRTHLFIPMHQRSYEITPPKWIVADAEFKPDSD
jgi:hypothetical protein